MKTNSNLTLGHVFALSIVGLVLLLGVLFYLVLDGSRQSIIQSSDRLRDEASREIATRVTNYLSQAEKAVFDFEDHIKHGAVDPQSMAALESGLYSLLLSNDNLDEASLTYGKLLGHDNEGNIRLAQSGRGQLSLFRIHESEGSNVSKSHKSRLLTRHIYSVGGRYISDLRDRPPDGKLLAAPLAKEAIVGSLLDPTQHLSFVTPASRGLLGRLLWSDLHWSQLDSYMSAEKRRVEVSVQKAILDAENKFVGVLRVGLLTGQIDRITELKMVETEGNDPHRIFIADNQGRLITRITPKDQLQVSGDDLRVVPDSLPQEIMLALKHPLLKEVTAKVPLKSGRFNSGGREYLATFRALGETQDWIVGIVAPEDYYLGALTETRNRLLIASLLIIAGIIAGGTLVLRSIKRAQAQIINETSKMNQFEFSPSIVQSPFADVRDSLESLEKAKTAMRAMGKYAPIELVRQLYCQKSEPVLGGEMMEISLMFTDIRDFTAYSEQLSPNQLAEALGRYLEVMAHVIQQETGGTIDKYVGDAIMALWNAPSPVADHPQMACRAALGCREAIEALFGSEAWKDLPPFYTRFGLHKDKVMVGHFGAPNRMNFTAIGDGVNLASRLEALNKGYGTTIIASQTIFDDAKGQFEFRLLDRVAVKGKTQGIGIYELLGVKNEVAQESRSAAANYEQAFEAYLKREFERAISILNGQPHDGPSAVLSGRCRKLLQEPPAADWNGVYVSTTK